jgi:hypothetical protein
MQFNIADYMHKWVWFIREDEDEKMYIYPFRHFEETVNGKTSPYCSVYYMREGKFSIVTGWSIQGAVKQLKEFEPDEPFQKEFMRALLEAPRENL